VNAETKVTLNDKAARLADLHSGDEATVTYQVKDAVIIAKTVTGLCSRIAGRRDSVGRWLPVGSLLAGGGHASMPDVRY
jgi:hypothetical protein